MPYWETHSNSRQQTTISVVCLVAGALLAATLRGNVDGESAAAGFWFGIILLIIGGATLAAHARQQVVVDPQLREIRIDDRRVVGHNLRRIPFDEVQDVQVAYLQTRSQRALRYFLQLQLRSGEAYALFAPERVYAGADDPAVVAAWQARLKDHLAAS